MAGKRIAYLTSVYPAPSHTFIRREVDALRARGVDIATFSIRRPAAASRFAPQDQAALETTRYLLPASPWAILRTHFIALASRPRAYLSTLFKAIGHRAPGAKGTLWALFYFVEAVVLAQMLKADGIEHVHNHFANPSADVGMLASHYLGITWSLTLHGSADWAYPAGYLLPKKIEAAKFVACVSQYGRAQAMRITPPEQWEKMFISRCGIDLSVFPDRKPRKEQSGPKQILTVGRLSPEKGQMGLLKAFSMLLASGVDAELNIIGDGPLRTQLEREIEALGLEARCRLLGQKTEAEVLLAMAEADLFVLSSFLEGLPVVLMEAMALGVPVIAPCVAGIPELVRDGKTGYLFVVGDWPALAEVMNRALVDFTNSSFIAEAGMDLVKAEFEVGSAVKVIESWLK